MSCVWRGVLQRRGRVLRQNKEKNKSAKIFDFLVYLPTERNENEKIHELEKNILRKELERAFEFVKFSKNRSDIFENKVLKELIEDYGLSKLYKILTN